MLNAENITVRYDTHAVVDRLSFSLEDGQWLMLAGPNGAGKSSLISAIAQGGPFWLRCLLRSRKVCCWTSPPIIWTWCTSKACLA